MDGTNVDWVEETLSPGVSAQKVELIALTKTLELGVSKKINTHMECFLCETSRCTALQTPTEWYRR